MRRSSTTAPGSKPTGVQGGAAHCISQLRREGGTMLQTKTMGIDADAHVLESERTWDYLEPADRKYRPVPVTVPADPSIGRARRDAWVIDGKIRGLRFPLLTEEELAALSTKLGRDMRTQQEAR